MAVEKIGIGVGTKVFEQANCVRIFLGESAETGKAGSEPAAQTEESELKSCRIFFGDQETHNAGMITELICNIDDMTPEALAFAGSRLLELGALDVYTVPGTMKKGRAGHVLTVLCAPEKEREMARHILEQTTTNGVRARRCLKYFLTPGSETVQTQWGPVRVKLAEGFGIRHAKMDLYSAEPVLRGGDALRVPERRRILRRAGRLLTGRGNSGSGAGFRHYRDGSDLGAGIRV